MAMADAKEWLYVDDDGVVQGPFSERQMGSWYARGLLPLTLLVRPKVGGRQVFLPLQRVRPVPEWTRVPPQETDERVGGDEVVGKEREDAQVVWEYVDEDGEVVEGCGTDQMVERLSDGRLKAQSLVRLAGTEEFEALETFVEFFGDVVPRGIDEFEVEDQEVPGEDDSEAEAKCWRYIDDGGEEQGPFTAREMKAWMEAGYFDSSVQVKRGEEVDYEEIGDRGVEMFDVVGESTKGKDEEEEKIETACEASGINGAAADEWFYLDPENNQQGPFKTEMMVAWHRAGYLAADLKIRRSTESSYHLLDDGAELYRDLNPAEDTPSQSQTAAEPGVTNEQQWMYRANDGVEYGPFSTAMMRYWYAKGLLNLQLQVKEAHETHYVSLGSKTFPFMEAESDASRERMSAAARLDSVLNRIGERGGETSTMSVPSQGGSYVQERAIGSRGVQRAQRDHWEEKGLAPDWQGRHMAHFFDHEAWQEQQRQRQQKRKGQGRQKR